MDQVVRYSDDIEGTDIRVSEARPLPVTGEFTLSSAGDLATEATLQSLQPGENAASATPSDTAPVQSRALYVGGAGDLVVTMAGGGDVTFSAVPAGFLLPVVVTRVKAATTATNIVAIW